MSIYRTAAGHQEIRRWCDDQLAAWDHPHERQALPTTLGTTHVVTTGTGPQIAMLAGTNFGATTWLDLVQDLSATHRVHAIDLPGQPGLSDAHRPRRARHQYGTWLGEVLHALGTTTTGPLVVAHSLGAVVALTAAAQGTPVRGLVLVDPAGLMRLRVSAAVMGATLPWLRRRDPRTSARLLQMMMAPATSPADELVTWMTLVGRHVRTSLAPTPVPRAELHDLAVPTLVLSGRHDAFLPPGRLARAARKRLPHADVTVVDHAGHLLPHERPDVVAAAITQHRTEPES